MKLVFFLNALIISFENIGFGKIIFLIFITIINLFNGMQGQVSKNIFALFALPSFLILRQIFTIYYNSIGIEYFYTIVYLIYFISFVALFNKNKLKKEYLELMFLIFVFINILFGFIDFFGVHIPFLIADENISERFRGTASEANNLAMPLALYILYKFKFTPLNQLNYYNFVIISVILIMLFLTASKAALLFVLISILLFSQLRKNLILIFFGFTISITIAFLIDPMMIFNLGVFTNFISLIDFEFMLSNGIQDFIKLISTYDQFIAGSFGTRLTTFYSSLMIFTNSPLFGYGEGTTHNELIKFIFSK